MRRTDRARRDAIAQSRLENAAKTLAEEHDLQSEYEAITNVRARDPQDQATLEREALADFFEALASKTEPAEVEIYDFSPILGERANEALHDGGYDTPEDLREASDEDLLALDGVGPATLTKIREEFGA